MHERDAALIRLMIETIDRIVLYTSDMEAPEDLEKDVKSFDATIMNFIVLGESVGKLSDDFKDKHQDIDWRKIYAFRNVLAHDYFGIYPAEVWEIIRADIPALKKALFILNS